MIGKGKSISHGVAALEYDLAKEFFKETAATEIGDCHIKAELAGTEPTQK